MTLAVHLYRRVLRRGRLIALLALGSVPALTYWLIAFDGVEDAPSLFSDILATAGFSFAIAVLILTVAVLREERDAGTLPYIYMRPIPRWAMALSAIAAGIAAALTLALGATIASLLALLATGQPSQVAFAGAVQFASTAIGYAAVFVPLGYLVPRSVLVGLGYIVVIESILAFAVTGLANISIWRIGLSIYADVAVAWDPTEAGEMLDPVLVGAGGGVAKLGLVLLIGFVVLTWALRRRDAL